MKFLFTATFLLILKIGFSYPTKYWTLKEMTDMSRSIVIATVDSVLVKVDPNLDSIYTQKTKLTFDKYIVGKPIDGDKYIEYIAGTRCPKPIQLKQGMSILLFVYDTHNDSAKNFSIDFIGLKHIENELQKSSFQTAILELKKIYKIKIGSARTRKITNWLMDCVQDPYLKFDASIDLARNLTYLERFCYHNEPSDNEKKYYRHLNFKQHKLLRSLIIDSDSFTQADLQIARILGKRNKRRTRNLLIDKLDEADKYLTEDVMAVILFLGRDSELNCVYDDYRKFLHNSDNWDNPNRDSILVQKRENFVKMAK